MRARLSFGFFVATTSALAWFLACGNSTFETASDAGISRSDATSSVEAGCPSGEGPSMVQVTKQPFCIDTTEVTNAQYASFLEAIADNTALADAGSSCAWNTTYQPATSGSCASATDGGMNQPVTCVDWCDAYSYCAWAGKHLCGGTSLATAPLDTSESVVAAQSQWELACSANGTDNYPYGEAYIASACNAPGAALADVGSFKDCVGGYAGIFDMAGNAAEWVDACEDGGNAGSIHDNCAELGDSYLNPHDDPSPGACPLKNYFPRGATNPDVGFRCCAN